MLILPETPRFLIKNDCLEKAAKSLSRLRRLSSDHEVIRAELAEVQANHEFETRMGGGTYLDCFRPPILKRQLTGMALQALQQLSGMQLPCGNTLASRLLTFRQVSISSFTTGPTIFRTPGFLAGSSLR